MAADLRTVFSTVIVHWINKLSLKPPAFKHEHSVTLKHILISKMTHHYTYNNSNIFSLLKNTKENYNYFQLLMWSHAKHAGNYAFTA